MAYRVTLTFVVDESEDSAWDIADGLEKAAIKRNWREVNGYVNAINARGQVLGPEGEPPQTAAETVVRRTGQAMGFGGHDGLSTITLGDEDGRSG